MIDRIKIEEIQCDCLRNVTSNRVVYMIYPAVNGFTDKWLEEHSQKNGISIVVVYVPLEKWNDWLTPWPEPGETPEAEPFAGEGSGFLKMMQEKIIPQSEKALRIDRVDERDLTGVSLAGLFTLWEWLQCDTFNSIACLSGSFWYMGFIDWFNKQPVPAKTGSAYFLLGTDEPKAHIKAYRTVGVNTEAIVTALKQAGIAVTFEWVPGNHFSNPLKRAEKALSHIATGQVKRL